MWSKMCVCFGDAVEGQSAMLPVQIHSYSFRGVRDGDVGAKLIVPESENLIRAMKAP